jgi:FYVE, RhoGEF and PH domain containing 5/6
MPSLPVQRQPQALMAIDTKSSCDIAFDNFDDVVFETEERERKGRVRIKSHQRVRSYQQLVEDFQEQSHAMRPRLSSKASQSQIRNVVGMDDAFEIDEHEGAEWEGGEEEEEQDHVDPFYTPTHSIVTSPVSSPRKPQRRVEDTARRSKRFSLPAIGLHTTVVTARTSIESEEVVPVIGAGGDSEEGAIEGVNTGLSKRFSLVLAGRNSHHGDVSASASQRDHSSGGQDDDLGLAKGLAATRLSELLGRKLSTKT